MSPLRLLVAPLHKNHRQVSCTILSLTVAANLVPIPSGGDALCLERQQQIVGEGSSTAHKFTITRLELCMTAGSGALKQRRAAPCIRRLLQAPERTLPCLFFVQTCLGFNPSAGT